MKRYDIIKEILHQDAIKEQEEGERLSHLSPEEQKRITDAIASIDRLIELQTQKLELLRQHRIGLKQKLIPAKGKTTSELRFPEFGSTDGVV